MEKEKNLISEKKEIGQLEHIINIQNIVLKKVIDGEELESVMNEIYDYLNIILPSIMCSLMIVDKDRKNLINISSSNIPRDYLEVINELDIGNDFASCGTAAYLEEMVIVNDIKTHPLWVDHKELALKNGIHACWANPIFYPKGRVYGIFSFYFPTSITPKENDLLLFDSITKVISQIVQHDQNKIIDLDSHDDLTKLPNIHLFKRVLQDALTVSDQRLAIMAIDLDRFKVFNGVYNYKFGNEVLREISIRMAKFIPQDCFLSRFSGDKFILFTRYKNKQEIEYLAEQILNNLCQPLFIDEEEVVVTGSIGISISPDDGEDTEGLINQANLTVDSIKMSGGNTYKFFNKSIVEDVYYQTIIEKELRKSLNKEEFLIYYQPQVDINSNSIIGVEALIRWNHSKFGLVSPEKFLPIAEETGLIVSIDEWVLRTACIQIKKWQKDYDIDLRLSVNVSTRLIQQQDIVGLVANVLEETNIKPNNLVLEITESVFIDDIDLTVIKLKQLKELGVQVAIDDFGTAYSSLNYLKKFPINTVKIDRSFINEITSCPKELEIVKSIIQLGHKLNLKIVAEGVESANQLEILKMQKCDEVQGFFFNKPLEDKDFEEKYIKTVVY